MASGWHEYTLVGFSEEVDRRPLFFVEPLPPAVVCSACGLVPNVKASLPCQHVFCKPCYKQCGRSGRVACPLDGDTCSAEEVIWMNHPTRGILAKQVLCWNQTNGCNVITAAADISKHFHHECGHHLARCPKCSVGILATDVCAHLESHCDASSVTSAAAVQAGRSIYQNQLAAQLAGFGEEMGGMQRKSKAESDRISMVRDRQYDRNSELSHNTNADEETVTRNSLKASEAHTEALAQNVSRIAWAKSSLTEDPRNVLARFPSIMRDARMHMWIFEEYESLKQRAQEVGFAEAMVEPSYLYGYCVSVGIGIFKDGKFRFLFQIRRGKIDQFLVWPFNLQMKFGILQPLGPKKLELCSTPSSVGYSDRFLRPVGVSGDRVIVWKLPFTPAEMERLGFVKDGRMHLCLTLDPIDDAAP